MDNINKGHTCKQIICTRRQIFVAVKDEWSSKFNKQVELLEKKFTEMEGCPFTISTAGIKLLRNTLSKMKQKWQHSHRMLERFYTVHKEWLDKDVTITNADFKNMDVLTPSSSTLGSDGSHERGIPSLNFTSSSERSKRRKVSELRKSTSPRTLAFATEMNLRASGSHAAANVLKDITTTSPTRASRYQSALAQSSRPVNQEISADAALNLIIRGKITEETYNMVRELTNEHTGDSVFPSYDKILAAKSRYPPEYFTNSSSFTETDTSAMDPYDSDYDF